MGACEHGGEFGMRMALTLEAVQKSPLLYFGRCAVAPYFGGCTKEP